MRVFASLRTYTTCLLIAVLSASLPAQTPATQNETPNQSAPAVQSPAPPASTESAPAASAPPSPAPAPNAPFGEITGSVKSGKDPLPGVTVTAANTLTGKKYITSTDLDGSFKLAIGAKGRYVVRAEFSAFAPVRL